LPGSSATNVIETTSDLLDEYFDNSNNPVISGYRQEMNLDDFYDEVISKAIWGHQVMGGAVGGRFNDPRAVSDGHGRIYNTQGLRVADISFAPTPFHGNPWVGAAQVGAVIARFVLDDWNNTYKYLNIMPLEHEHPLYVNRTAINKGTLHVNLDPPRQWGARCFGIKLDPPLGDCDEYETRLCLDLDDSSCGKNKCCVQRTEMVPSLEDEDYVPVQDVLITISLIAAVSGLAGCTSFVTSFMHRSLEEAVKV